MVLKSLLFTFFIVCKIEAKDFFNQDEEKSGSAR